MRIYRNFSNLRPLQLLQKVKLLNFAKLLTIATKASNVSHSSCASLKRTAHAPLYLLRVVGREKKRLTVYCRESA